MYIKVKAAWEVDTLTLFYRSGKIQDARTVISPFPLIILDYCFTFSSTSLSHKSTPVLFNWIWWRIKQRHKVYCMKCLIFILTGLCERIHLKLPYLHDAARKLFTSIWLNEVVVTTRHYKIWQKTWE